MPKRKSCRSCGSEDLHMVLSLGETPLVNAFLRPEEFSKPEKFYPLELYYCPTCHLVQLLEVVAPDVLFRDTIYVTGTSDSMAAHNAALAERTRVEQNLQKDDLVIDIGSNDGSLLSCFLKGGVRVLGIEPARDIAELSRQKGIDVLSEFFNADLARLVRQDYGPAAVVTATNVLAHVDDTLNFLQGIRALLQEGGISIIEVPYLVDMIDFLEYDTIYHEHLCYFSVAALIRFFTAAGLAIFRIDKVDIHGGSLRVYSRANNGTADHAPEIYQRIEQEKRLGLMNLATYLSFARRVEANREALRSFLYGLKSQGFAIAGYGAAAKGNTLLNYCGLGTDIIKFIVDKNPLKVGKYTPGMHIPVHHVDRLIEDRPDYVLILAWNFKEEIMRQQSRYKFQGGRFIVPIPEPAIID